MGSYGKVAVRAAALIRDGKFRSPAEAWASAARELLPHSESSQDKSCPRGAFLGLCDEGLVAGVPAGSYTRSPANKSYAVRAAGLLRTSPELAAQGPTLLWDRVVPGGAKRHNGQMDVVLGLHADGLLGPA